LGVRDEDEGNDDDERTPEDTEGWRTADPRSSTATTKATAARARDCG